MILRSGKQAKLGEDRSHVRLDGLGRQEQPLADRLVRPALGHERKDLSLPTGEVSHRAVLASSSQEVCHDLRVDRGPTSCDPPDGLDELADVGYAILEQVPDASGA